MVGCDWFDAYHCPPLSRFALSFHWPRYLPNIILAELVVNVLSVACPKCHRLYQDSPPIDLIVAPSNNWCQAHLVTRTSFAERRLGICAQVAITRWRIDARDDRQ